MANAKPVQGDDADRPTLGSASVDAPTCRLGDEVESLKDRLSEEDWEVCLVVNEEAVVLGSLEPDALEGSDGSVEDIMTPGPGTFRPYVSLEKIREYLEDDGLDHVIVTTSEGKLIGIVPGDQLERS